MSYFLITTKHFTVISVYVNIKLLLLLQNFTKLYEVCVKLFILNTSQ